MQLEAGMEIIDGRYVLNELIVSQGKEGTVWKAYDKSRQDNFYAIKHYERDANLPDHHRLDRAVEISKMLKDCPYIVKIDEQKEWRGDLFLIMQYIPGKTLRDRLTEQPYGGGLDKDLALSLALQLCDALAAMHDHAATILHRDVKAENIMITDDNRLVLIDLTSAQRSDQTQADGLTPNMAPKGTYGHSSIQTDIYHAAIVVYEMWTGRYIAKELRGKKGAFKALVKKDIIGPQVYKALRKVLEDENYKHLHGISEFRQDLAAPQQRLVGEELRRQWARFVPARGTRRDAAESQIPIESNMVLIPKGTYVLGFSPARNNRIQEKVVALIKQDLPYQKKYPLEKSFYIDPFPVTNRDYAAFLNAPKYTDLPVPHSDGPLSIPYNWDPNTRRCQAGCEDHPVVLVSFDEARAYAKWADKRLPTEQEWEIAARGPNAWLYPWGNDWQTDYCNNLELQINQKLPDDKAWEYWMRAALSEIEYQLSELDYPALMRIQTESLRHTTPVTQFAKQNRSHWGVCDLVGNVWEWTDSKDENEYRVLRGGSWLENRAGVRAVTRIFGKSQRRWPWVGFRCACDEPN